ncbi:hypothetical protein J751_3629 [Acinetobacter baumannii 24812_8]|uniref:hypothetical protein n=1 Tax=Acinetobacter baumannii TaxID=470 RepID=UPI00046147A2|nr:hypothetical protein [Acinetobacter baumannii]KCY51694.1 hypothetical protein J751_3629 [Acinetobacter baumannii 24812_8]
MKPTDLMTITNINWIYCKNLSRIIEQKEELDQIDKKRGVMGATRKASIEWDDGSLRKCYVKVYPKQDRIRIKPDSDNQHLTPYRIEQIDEIVDNPPPRWVFFFILV